MYHVKYWLNIHQFSKMLQMSHDHEYGNVNYNNGDGEKYHHNRCDNVIDVGVILLRYG